VAVPSVLTNHLGQGDQTAREVPLLQGEADEARAPGVGGRGVSSGGDARHVQITSRGAAYVEGGLACQAGEERNANPYADELAKIWDDGWLDMAEGTLGKRL
jgi:hypothetical protein